MTNDIRIHERDLVIPLLAFLAERPDGFGTTTEIIGYLEDKFGPEGEDAEILDGRSDTRFSQIVRNIVSHRHTESSAIRKGWAEYDKDQRGLRITDVGRSFLREVEA